MKITKSYDNEFKQNAVRLAGEIGAAKAMRELGVPNSTFYQWVRKSKTGELDVAPGTQKPRTALSLAEEIKRLKQENRRQEMELREKERTIEILKEASIFFAQGRKK
jgi:transposase